MIKYISYFGENLLLFLYLFPRIRHLIYYQGDEKERVYLERFPRHFIDRKNATNSQTHTQM